MSGPVLSWFRRDLRLSDHPALRAAAARAGAAGVVPVFVADEVLLAPAGPTRVAYVVASLRALNEDLGGALCVRVGRPRDVLADLARETGATAVFATGDAGPYGRQRDRDVAQHLDAHGVEVTFLDTPYVVAPGVVHTKTGDPCRVFSAYRRGWDVIDGALPSGRVETTWLAHPGHDVAVLTQLAGRRRPTYFGYLPDEPPPTLAPAGERAAVEALNAFLPRVRDYHEGRTTRPSRRRVG
jgi:deoxyribodipyrimidine photo-lyase